MAVPQDRRDGVSDGGAVGKQSQLSGLMGSTFTALDSKVQNGKEKEREEPCLHPPQRRQAKPGASQPGASGLCASSLPTLEGRGWVEIWPKLLSSLSLASTAELGQLVSSPGMVPSLAAGRRAVHPCSTVGTEEKSLSGVGERVGWGAVALGCAGQGLKQSPTVAGGELSPHSMDSMGKGAGQGHPERGNHAEFPRTTKP